jgi:hypothetical protein
MRIESLPIRASNLKLLNEFERLKHLTGLGAELKVVWKPLAQGTLSGEVKNNTIYIYETAEAEAVETLRHEFVDFCISQCVEPYKKITNQLIIMVNADAYREKEKVVEGLAKLLHVCNR